jgi:hypothetical protein
MRITTFDGGLNTRVDSHLIKVNEARELINVDTDKATLTPIKDKLLVSETSGKYGYYFSSLGQWFFDTAPADYIEYKDILYKTDRVGLPKKIIGGTEYDLGIEAPISGTITTATSAPNPVSRVDFTSSNTGGSDLPTGTYEYKIINRDSTTLLESTSYFETPTNEATAKPDVNQTVSKNTSGTTIAGIKYTNYLSGTVTSGDNEIDIDVNDTHADEIKVFRRFDGTWREVTAGFVSMPATITDNVYDISAKAALDEDRFITGTITYAITNYDSVRGVESAPILTSEVEVSKGQITLTNIPVSANTLVDKKRIYRIGGNLTSYSLVATIDNAATSFTDSIADTDIIGTILSTVDNDPAPTGLRYLKESYSMLFGALEDKLRFTPIGKPDAWPEEYFLDFPATITGISKTAIGLLVHTYYTTFLITGTGPTSFVQQPLANDQGCISHDSIQETKDTAIWASTDGICISDGSDVKVISRDKLGKLALSVSNSTLFDQVYRLHLTDGLTLALDFERGIFKRFRYGVDSLAIANDELYGIDLNNDLYKLEASELLTTLEYKSPNFASGSYTVEKAFTDVKFHVIGSAEISVYIDDTLALTQTKLTTGIHELKLPEAQKRGVTISFEVKTSGIVRELSWPEASING